MKRGMILFAIALLFAGFVSGLDELDFGNLLVKASLKEGETATKILSLSSDVQESIVLEVLNIQGVSLSDENVVIGKNEKKSIRVVFDSKGLKPGVYTGNLKISDGKKDFYIPLIFEIESRDVFFDVNLDIPPYYSEVVAGEKIIIQLKLFDLVAGGGTQNGLGPTNVELSYYVTSSEGVVLNSEQESIVVDRQAQVSKTLSFPKNTKEGDYIVSAIAKYENSVGVSSAIFSITSSSGGFNFDFTGAGFQFLIVILVIVLFFFGLIFLFVYMIKDRDKLILELKKYNSNELKLQRQFLEKQRVVARSKNVDEGKIRREIDEKVSEIKREQARRLKQFRVLRKNGNKNEMIRKMEEWKRQGYNISPMNYKLRELNVSDMKDIMSGWKKKGYKF